MKHALICALSTTLAGLAAPAFAQVPNVGATAVGIVSFQPVGCCVGGPYVDQGLGGIAPGFGGGLDRVTDGGLILAGEFTTAFFSVEQSGRLVSAPNSSSTNRLRDAMVSGLIGYASRRYKTEAHSMIGAAFLVSDRRRAKDPLVLTGGIDLVHPLSARVGFVVGGRYAFIRRTDSSRHIGVGPHVIRAAIGVRYRYRS